jgi:serine/threonine protein kinase
MNMSPERWKQIEQLYHAALEQSPQARDIILAKAGPEVGSILLKLLSEPGNGILDQPAWQTPAWYTEDETCLLSPAVGIAPGTILGPYRIESRIGAGGMGEVFRAWDTRLARQVAIKAIRPTQFGGSLETQFLEEARAASALNHPNIITIYDIGSSEGSPYLVMEWIEGKTLRQRLALGTPPVSEVLEIGSRIVDALAAAHEGGILHRDLKPENIMLNAKGQVKVLDFGIARRITPSSTETSELDFHIEPGLVAGTPGYMSPEQARGEKARFSLRSLLVRRSAL